MPPKRKANPRLKASEVDAKFLLFSVVWMCRQSNSEIDWEVIYGCQLNYQLTECDRDGRGIRIKEVQKRCNEGCFVCGVKTSCRFFKTKNQKVLKAAAAKWGKLRSGSWCNFCSKLHGSHGVLVRDWSDTKSIVFCAFEEMYESWCNAVRNNLDRAMHEALASFTSASSSSSSCSTSRICAYGEDDMESEEEEEEEEEAEAPRSAAEDAASTLSSSSGSSAPHNYPCDEDDEEDYMVNDYEEEEEEVVVEEEGVHVYAQAAHAKENALSSCPTSEDASDFISSLTYKRIFQKAGTEWDDELLSDCFEISNEGTARESMQDVEIPFGDDMMHEQEATNPVVPCHGENGPTATSADPSNDSSQTPINGNLVAGPQEEGFASMHY